MKPRSVREVQGDSHSLTKSDLSSMLAELRTLRLELAQLVQILRDINGYLLMANRVVHAGTTEREPSFLAKLNVN